MLEISTGCLSTVATRGAHSPFPVILPGREVEQGTHQTLSLPLFNNTRKNPRLGV